MSYTLIYNGTLIDGNGGESTPNAAILIENNKIIDVGTEDSIRIPGEEIERIDVHGMFILPGFIDSHVHIMANGFKLEDAMYELLAYYFYKGADNLKQTINAGVTTVRDAGFADIGVKMAVDDGLITGPRLFISVMPLSTSGGHFDLKLNSGFDMRISYPGFPENICDGEAEVRKRVREVLRAGADFIKLSTTGGVMSANDGPKDIQFTVEELKVVVHEAKCHGDKKVMVHAHGAEGIKNALNAGVYSIEHGSCLDDEAIKMMVNQGTYLIPTFVVMKNNKKFAEAGELPEYSTKQAIEIVDIHEKSIKKAYNAGVKIVMGSDCGVVPHGLNLEELGNLSDIGMSPIEAIMAGTKSAAIFLGIDDKLGTIESGKIADIVISKKDPVANIKSLGNPDNIMLVMKEGQIVKDLRT